MPVDSHIHSLEQRHQELEGKLEHLQTSPSVNDCEITDLKRQKLLLKDRIEHLKAEINPA